MNKLIFNGYASNSLSELDTTSFCIDIETENSWILVDVGPDTPRKVNQNGISFLDISHIVITHRHLDHCLGLPYLLFGRRLEVIEKRKNDPSFKPGNLTVVIETDLFEQLQNLYNFAHPDAEDLFYSVDIIDITNTLYSTFSLGDVKIDGILMDHTVPAFGLLFTDKHGNKLAYTTDSLPVENFIDICSGSEIVIAEAMIPTSLENTFGIKAKHASTRQAGETARLIGAKQGFLVHLQPIFFAEREDLSIYSSNIAGIKMEYPELKTVYQPWNSII